MSVTFSNPCVRCGTERVILRTWEEKVGYSTVTNTEKICPNPACQKQVNKDNKRQKDKREAIKLKSKQRALNRKRTKKINKK